MALITPTMTRFYFVSMFTGFVIGLVKPDLHARETFAQLGTEGHND
ncbi:hypothetical protein ACU8KH_05856 [Lachancea thermotolerans]